MEDMFQDVDVWSIIDGTNKRPTNTGDDQTAWGKKNKAALGALGRRINTGLMTHVSRGIAAMTMLRNKFASLPMNKDGDLESHTK
ncbi:hypothetical protein FRC12_024572 [Ceratobasidium sp. 428]|nr:hypothetical protein FRC12_024572 [Ceratobasidium sp. 428]